MPKSFNLDQHFNYYFFVLQRYGKKFQHVIGATLSQMLQEGIQYLLQNGSSLSCEHENCNEDLSLKYDCQLRSTYNGDVLCKTQTVKEP
jgi:hypothetical protein